MGRAVSLGSTVATYGFKVARTSRAISL